MALTPSFVVSNNNVNTNQFTVTDTSTGADPNVVDRQILIYLSDNSLFATIDFPLAYGSSISPTILTQDFTCNMTINWLDSGGVILYTSSQIGIFTGFLEWFYYSLTQTLASKPNIANDTEWYYNYSKLRTFIDSATQAIQVGLSVFNAQNMILMGQYLETNQQLFF